MLDSTWGAERFIIAHTDGMMKPWWRIEIAAWTAHSGVPALRIAAFVCSVEAAMLLGVLELPGGQGVGGRATLLDLLARHRVIARPDLERRGGQRALLGAVQGLLASGLLAGGGGIG
jgi:hypothetical protein